METSSTAGWTSLNHLKHVLSLAGSEQVLVKALALNQDNEKNQIYLGGDDSLLSLLPGSLGFLAESESTNKRHSAPGVGKEVLKMEFFWLQPDGVENLAPDAKLIFYMQYPELRLSGFLKGSSEPPRSLRRNEQDEFGRRVLLLAIRAEQVLGVVVTDRDSPELVDQLLNLELFPGHALLRQLPLSASLQSPDLDRLIGEIRALSRDWHEACVLKSDTRRPVPRQAQQGSGWTLEALLGIPMNGTKGPDKYGYEIKVLPRSGPVSLITSEPDFGWRKERGLTDYLHEFGWPGTKGDGSYRFNGKHDTQRPYDRSHAMVVIDHWDPISNGPDGTGEPNVLLLHTGTDTVIAGWTFESLAAKWSKKHSGCVYVEYQRRPESGLATDYRYGPHAHIGQGTSINHLLRSLSSGSIYLDPGDRVNADGAEKARMQWRTSGSRNVPITSKLHDLYQKFTTIDI